ncbi:MAG: DUF4345 domain-containing protein [Gammaproteobacteria bacterium HGW-Gammaproteobacteria-1]|jgi:hypothetical protein|nr:MAG: DUF4345 domain-containing protein [Gammaproteobacteria bacterium HGW-Gammaproteobacteria-1]
MEFGRIVVWINCGLFVGFGLGFVFTPEALAAVITGAAPATPSAMTDMRATYGGMALGLALIFGLCARNGESVRLGVHGVLAVMVALAVARTLGMLLDGSPNTFMFVLLLAEVVMAFLALWALRQVRVE